MLRGMIGTLAAAAIATAASAPAVAAAVAANAGGAANGQNFFVADTTASALSLVVTQTPASSIVTASAIDDAVGYAASAYDTTGGSEAQAASVYPGSLVIQGPTLLCTEGILPFACPVTPPAYPLLADATFPNHDSATVGSTTAKASAVSNSGSTSTGSFEALKGTPAAIGIGGQTSSSSVNTTKRAMTVTVTTHISDVDVAGLLKIASVTSTDSQLLVAGHRPVDHPSITVSGVTLLGQSVGINSHGLQIGGHSRSKLLSKLVAHGLSIEPVIINRHDTRNGARSDISGLIVHASLPITNAPYIANPLGNIPPFNQVPGIDLKGTYLATLTLGAVGAAGGIQHQTDVGLGGLGGPLPGNSPPPSRSSAPTSSQAATPPVNAPSVGPAAVGRGGGSTPTVAGPAPQATIALSGPADFSIKWLYLLMSIATAALFIAWRVRVLVHRRST